MEKNHKLIGKGLYIARNNKDITLEAAGNKIGVNKSTIQRWENGNVEKFKIPLIEILAEFYDVNPQWLMGHNVPAERNIKNNENLLNELTCKYGKNSIELLDNFQKLNDLGQEKAIENLKDLTEIPKYVEKNKRSVKSKIM